MAALNPVLRAVTEAAIFGPDNAYVIFTSNLACPIGRPVVNNNDLKIGVTKLSETLQALSDRAASIKGANHNGDARRTPARGERYFAKSLADLSARAWAHVCGR